MVVIMKRFRMSLEKRKTMKGYLFILPWLIGFLVFYLRSLIMTCQFSFSELTVQAGGGYTLDFVGLDNFIYCLRGHATFKQVLTLSVTNLLVDIPLIIFFSLLMAMLLNKKFKGRSLVRAIFFLPVLMNSEAITQALQFCLQSMLAGVSPSSAEVATNGALNVDFYLGIMRSLSIPSGAFEYVIGAVQRINDIVTASGVQIIIFIAALQSIPGSLYEVAKIEGATGYETFWKVTLPMVTPHIITNIVYTVVINFASSDVISLAYDEAFVRSDYGLSSAMSIISSLVICLILFIVVRIMQKRTFYYN